MSKLILVVLCTTYLSGCVKLQVDNSKYNCPKRNTNLIQMYIKTCSNHYPRLVCEDKAKEQYCKKGF